MPRLTLPPATGTCRWLDDAANGNRQLMINGTVYEVEVLPHGWALYRLDPDPAVLVVRHEVRPDPQVVGLWTCNCPDATNRPERKYSCKHVMSLKAALKRLPF